MGSLSEVAVFLDLSQSWMTPCRRRGLGDRDAPPAGGGKCSNKKCLRRIGDKRDWAMRTILISAPLVPPRYNCLCRLKIRATACRQAETQCWSVWSARVLLTMLDAHSGSPFGGCGPGFVGRERPKGGGAGWEIWIEGRRVWVIISWDFQ